MKYRVTDINFHSSDDPCIRVRVAVHQSAMEFEGWASSHQLDILVPSNFRNADEIAREALRRIPALFDAMKQAWRPPNSDFKVGDELDALG